MGYGNQSSVHNEAVRKAIEKGKIEWHMWGNVLAITGSICMIIGGGIGLAGSIGTRWVEIYAVAAGLAVFTMEWARGARKRGRTMPRTFQQYITPWLAKFGSVWSNLWIRGLLHLAIAMPCFFTLGTIIGGAVLVITGIVYVVAGFKGETWKPLIARERRETKGQVIKAPTAAPPRRPPTNPSPAASNEPKQSLIKHEIAANKSFNPMPTVRERPAPTAAAPSAPPRRPVPTPAGRTGGPNRPPPRPTQPSWEAVVDPSSGNTYYVNNDTNETQWDRPVGFTSI